MMFAGYSSFGFAGVIDPVDPSPDPKPLCGEFIFTNTYTLYGAEAPSGDCDGPNGNLNKYNKKMTVTKYEYDHGDKFYCSGWTTIPGCSSTYSSPACPSNTCSNP